MVPGQVLGGKTASLGALQLGVVDASGVAWSLATLEGWDSPEVRSNLTDREGDHGSWYDPVYLGSRPVTLTGLITAFDTPSLDNAIEQLLAAVSFTDTVLVVNDTIPKQAVVRRSGKPIVQTITDRLASYSVLVTAADSRRYDVNLQTASTALPSTTGGLVLPATLPWTLSAVTVAGSLSAANAGSMDTTPVFTISGPVSQPQVAVLYPDGTVQSLLYTGPDLSATDSLVIDTDLHSVTQGGASRRRWIQVAGDWPTIPAATTVQVQFRAAAYQASALLTASWRSAWI